MKTECAKGWGVRVGGGNDCTQYIGGEFHWSKESAIESCTEKYHRPVKVVLVPLAEYRRMNLRTK